MAFKKREREDKVLDVDASMQGTLNFKDPVNLNINGKFEGTLETKGNLTIGVTANVTADVVGDDIVIAGRVKGKITARGRLVMLPTAVVEGNIFPFKLSISEGALFEGKCNMLSDFMNAEELSRYLEVEVSSITEWANTGKIPSLKEGDNWKFERKSIDTWIAQGKIGR